MNYDNIDREIIHLLQGDLPLKSHPYEDIASKLNIDEKDIVARIASLKQRGVIRRCGAVLRHHNAGYISNAMVVWKVDSEDIDQAGKIMAGYKEVSHCYWRDTSEKFASYQLFTMIHAKNDEKMSEIIEKITRQTGLKDYNIIMTKKEFKKVSLRYI